jgi:hypothetical protein
MGDPTTPRPGPLVGGNGRPDLGSCPHRSIEAPKGLTAWRAVRDRIACYLLQNDREFQCMVGPKRVTDENRRDKWQ